MPTWENIQSILIKIIVPSIGVELLIDTTKHSSPEDNLPLIESINDDLTKVEAADNPWLAIAGSLSDDPFFEDYIAEIELYRQQLDREIIDTEDDRVA